jgi:hypothetical protein
MRSDIEKMTLRSDAIKPVVPRLPRRADGALGRDADELSDRLYGW